MALIGGQTAHISEGIVTRCVGAPSWERLKADNTDRGHVDTQMSGVRDLAMRHATEMMGASPGHHDARMCLSDVICHTGAAGKVVAGVRSWPDSESQTSRGRFGQDQTDACQTRSAGRLSTLNDGTGTKGMNFVSRFGMFREVKPFGMELA
jgi:hypothetical protein